MRNFNTLKVWQKAHELVLDVYRHTQCFPSEERFGLTAQLRRSAASIPANIAEGCGRHTDREFAHFLNIAAGSASETEYHLLLALDLGFLEQAPHAALTGLVREIRKMLAAFRSRLTAER